MLSSDFLFYYAMPGYSNMLERYIGYVPLTIGMSALLSVLLYRAVSWASETFKLTTASSDALFSKTNAKGWTLSLDEHKMVVRRLALLVAAALVVFALYALRLIFLQQVHGEEFADQATNTTEYRFNVTAARGDIVDSAGRRIATSTTSYNVGAEQAADRG